MVLKNKYDLKLTEDTVNNSLKKIINQIYRLLPVREEDGEWVRPLETILEELAGMHDILITEQKTIFQLICKLEGLYHLTRKDDFFSLLII